MGATYAELLNRIYLVTRPVTDTWKTLSEEDQDAWRQFFYFYCINVAQMTPVEARKFGFAFAQLWAISHEYYRYYGQIWGTNGKEDTMTTSIHPHGEHVCYCPYCGYEVTVNEDQKCRDLTCPACNSALRAKEIGERRGR